MLLVVLERIRRDFALGPKADTDSEEGRFLAGPAGGGMAFGMLAALELGTAALALLSRSELAVEPFVRLAACEAGAVGSTTFSFRPRDRSEYRGVLAGSAMTER